VNTSELSSVLGRLAAGALRFAATDARERAELARRTALATVAVAAPWAEAAVAIKRAVPGSGSALAEELATGPMGTARLCLLTARAQLDIAERGLPRAPSTPRLLHAGRRSVGGTPPALVGLDLLPALGPSGSLHDGMIHQGFAATVRCHDPGGLANFEQAWRREVEERPRAGGVAVIAHPARYSRFTPTEEYALFTEFKNHGGQAVEVVTGSHSALEYVKYAETAVEFGLAASRGSDFHSPDESHTDLGTLPFLPGALKPVWELLADRIQ
jgi:hypothetical protein